MDANHCTLYPYRNDPSLLLDANFVVCLCLSAKRYNNKHQMSSPSYPYVGFVRLARECSNREAMARQTRFMSHAGLPKRCGSAGLSSTGQYPEKFPPPPPHWRGRMGPRRFAEHGVCTYNAPTELKCQSVNRSMEEALYSRNIVLGPPTGLMSCITAPRMLTNTIDSEFSHP